MASRNRIKTQLDSTQGSVAAYSKLPVKFDSSEHWPLCSHIIETVDDQVLFLIILLQNKRYDLFNSTITLNFKGDCGSCWAVSAAAVLTNRFCGLVLTNKTCICCEFEKHVCKTSFYQHKFISH